MREQESDCVPPETKTSLSYCRTAGKDVRDCCRDALTGLPNQTLFYDRLKQAVLNAQRTERALMILYLNLDGFNQVNVALGSENGDELLVEAGSRITSALRKSDTVARCGSDEFMILAQNIVGRDAAETVAERVLEAFRKPFRIMEFEFFISASIGCAVFPVDGEDDETLAANVRKAMRRAKKNGGNNVVFCSTPMISDIPEELKLTNSLYRALEHGEFELYYQPQVNLNSGEIVWLEALLRWNHPVMGMIEPNKFVPIAEKTGLILKIGDWVIKTACRQNKYWQETGLIMCPMAVNLSVRQLEKEDIAEVIEETLRQTGLCAEYLELEFTESLSMRGIVGASDILWRLKNLGVGIAIDDFGTAYSSFNHLKLMPLDAIKIDKSFIDGIGKNVKDEAIVKAVITLTKSLGLKVVAEGVETERQIEFLRREGCHIIQGYYYHRPMPAGEIEKLLRERSAAAVSHRQGLG